MKGLDKSLQRSGSMNTVSPSVVRRSQDLDSLDGMPSGSTTGRAPGNVANDSLDRRAAYTTAYAGNKFLFVLEVFVWFPNAWLYCFYS